MQDLVDIVWGGASPLGGRLSIDEGEQVQLSVLSRWEEHSSVSSRPARAAGHIDDHFLFIARLAHQLSKFGLAVEAGDLVITGSFTRVRPGLPSGAYVGEFSGTGEVRVKFTDKT